MVRITPLTKPTYDPQYVTPINVATRDTNEYMVKRILKHDFTDPNNKLWLVQWQLDGDEKPFEVLKDVEAFHHYCAANGLSTLFPKHCPAFAHINRSQHKRHKEPSLMTATLPDQAQPNKRRGRPPKASVSQPLENKREKEPPLMTVQLPDQAQPNKWRGCPNKAPVSSQLEAVTPEDA